MDATDLPPGRSPGWASPDPDHPATDLAPATADWPPIPTLTRPLLPPGGPSTRDFPDQPAAFAPTAADWSGLAPATAAPLGGDDPAFGDRADDPAPAASGWAGRRSPTTARTGGDPAFGDRADDRALGPPGLGGPASAIAGPAGDEGPGFGRAAVQSGPAARQEPVGGGVVARAGGVATWLPEGRWAEAADEPVTDPPPQPARGRVDARRRRRGQRRLAATRIVARLAGWPRRALAVALLLAAVALTLRPEPPTAAVAPAPVGAPVVVAGRDLPAGAVLARPDLRTASLPTAVIPAGAAREPATLLGRTVAGPVRRGEVLTDARVVGPGLTAGLGPGNLAAAPVRLADPQAAALVRPGDRVDVLGAPVDADGPSRDALEVAVGVRVLAVLRGKEDADGVVIVVAADPAAVRRLAGAASRHRLTVAVRPP